MVVLEIQLGQPGEISLQKAVDFCYFVIIYVCWTNTQDYYGDIRELGVSEGIQMFNWVIVADQRLKMFKFDLLNKF